MRERATAEPFHRGEVEVQGRAGVRAQARRIGGIVRPGIAPPLAGFLGVARVAAVGAADGAGHVWATLLVGEPGFLRALDPDAADGGDFARLRVDALPVAGDRLARTLAEGAPGLAVGLVAIDFATRRRVRVNGLLAARALAGSRAGFAVDVVQAYVNCPKYIQARAVPPGAGVPAAHGPDDDVSAGDGTALTVAQRAWVARADTCFVASVGPDGSADASHRGGAPGFVDVGADGRLRIPDYSGNTMFNTLGNVAADPRVGLVFPDFARGRLLQLGGTARVDWRREVAAAYPGAERVLEITVERVHEVARALPTPWPFLGASPFNPPAGWPVGR